MHTKETLLADLKALGLRHTDTVLVHSSMKAIGEVEGGADTVLAALGEYLSEGLLVFPTHTWRQMGENYRVFNAATEPSCVGLLSNLSMRLPGAVRSLHPSHSVCAIGRDAANYVAGDIGADTPCPRRGTWGRLIDRKAVILLLGCSPKNNTFLHCVEELCGVPDRIAPAPIDYTVVAPDGRSWTIPFHPHYCSHGHISENYDKVMPLLLQSGAAWLGRFGDATVYAERADLVYEQVADILAKDPDYFLSAEHN